MMLNYLPNGILPTSVDDTETAAMWLHIEGTLKLFLGNRINFSTSSEWNDPKPSRSINFLNWKLRLVGHNLKKCRTFLSITYSEGIKKYIEAISESSWHIHSTVCIFARNNWWYYWGRNLSNVKSAKTWNGSHQQLITTSTNVTF